MIARWWISFIFAFCATAAAAQPHTCPAPGTLVYPLDEVLRGEGLSLEFDFEATELPAYGSEAYHSFVRDTVLSKLDGKSQAERDALLLARLDWSTIGTLPLLSITTFKDVALFDTYLDVLDRNELTDHAAALRMARDAFPIWNTTAKARYDQWSDGRGAILNPVLDATLRRASDQFNAAQPTLLSKAGDLIKSDPSLPTYMAMRDGASDDSKLSFMLYELGACIPYGDTFNPDPAILTKVPQPVADLHLIHMLFLEGGNGGFHQYIFNSTGALAPDMIAALRRLELEDHAQEAEDALNVFPAPYPRDTNQRRDVMRGFLKSQDDVLYDATWIVDDGAIFDAAKALAQREGYWPQ